MSAIDLQPVIIAGGSGTRLWPLSRASLPEAVPGAARQHSLFQQAAQRLQSLAAADIQVSGLCVVGNEDHRFLVLDQLTGLRLPPATVLLEPTGRNTAPAMTLAALQATQQGRDPVLVVTPADQSIGDEAAFTAALQRAVRAAAGGAFVILGVAPDRPETGYGYIRCERSPHGEMKVARFVEKPDAATAQRYLDEGGYYWNSGMFVVRASVWLKALGQFRPDILAATRAAWDGRSVDASFVRPDKAQFEAIPSESVDYAVMEKCPATAEFDIRMVPLAAGWSDLGAWDAVWQVSAKDAAGNATRGDALLQRQPRHAGACHQPAGRRDRPAGRGGGRDARCGAGGRPLRAARRSSTSSASCSAPSAASTRCIGRCTAPGAGTTASTPARASRSSASWSSPARR